MEIGYSSSNNTCRQLELTLRGVLLAVVLTVLLAMSNAFLALKLGILTSASIPAAMLSMSILRWFNGSTVLENNAVQTAASAGEAVAGGIVYTIPALIVIGYWHHFDYVTNVMIALFGGVLGVLFSIPLRKYLVHDRTLAFPEGQAIAHVLQSSSGNVGVKDIIYGGGFGALFELLQSGFGILAGSISQVFVIKRTLFVLCMGFSSTMLSAGYLMGFDLAVSVCLGAVIAWGIALPIASHVFPWISADPAPAMMGLWTSELRYLGIGAMLFAGLWTLVRLAKPMALRIFGLATCRAIPRDKTRQRLRTEQDLPVSMIISSLVLITLALFYFFSHMLPFDLFGMNQNMARWMILASVTYVLVIGFFFSVITSYFSGMVGVTASPGSAVVIAGILFAAWIMMTVLSSILPLPLNAMQLSAAEAMVMIMGAIVTGIAAIANDNTQDLKVGQLLGATPWKQQLMLLLGVVVASLVIPPVMQLLFEVYGIAGVMPHAGMDPAQSLPAPTAAMFAAITLAVFQHNLPFGMMLLGAVCMLAIMLLLHLMKLSRFFKLSMLGVGMGMYLPLTTTLPLFAGGLMARFIQRRTDPKHHHIGTRIACGMLAGASLSAVFLAVPAGILHKADPLRLVGSSFTPYSVLLSILALAGLWLWMRQRVLQG